MTGTLSGGSWDRTPSGEVAASPGKRSRTGRKRSSIGSPLGYIPLTLLFAASLVAAVVGWRHEAPAPPPPLPQSSPVLEEPAAIGSPESAATPADVRRACRSDVEPGEVSVWSGERGQSSEAIFQENAASMQGPYVLGEDGQVFWGDVMVANFSQALGRDPWTSEELRAQVDGLRSLQQRLSEQGSELLVVVAPAKWDIMPENLPAWSQPLRGINHFDQLLSAAGDLPIVDVRGAVREAAAETPVYSTVNSHWSPYGARIGWQKAVECLEALYPQYAGVPVPEISEVNLVDANSEFVSLGHPAQAKDSSVPTYAPPIAPIPMTGSADQDALDGPLDMLFLPVTTNQDDGVDSTVLFARDSMGTDLSVLMAHGFDTVCHERHNIDAVAPAVRTDLVDAASRCGADLVVLEFSERYLGLPPL